MSTHVLTLVARLLPGAVPIATRNDVSLSEGEVPLSPGDTRWKTFTDTRTKQTLRGNNSQ